MLAYFFRIWAILATMAGVGHASAEEAVRIGVLAYRGPAEAVERWSPTAAYLSTLIPEYRFEITPLTVDSTERAVADAAVAFLLSNPGKFVDLASRYGIARIATLKSNRSAVLGGGRIGAAVFVLADRKDIQSLADLRGRTLAAVGPDSFDDFQIAWGEMQRQGIDPFVDLEALKFVGLPKDSVVRSVQSGAVDAGVARSGLLEMMADDGHLDLGKFRILNPREEPDFPYRLSTRLYPEWALAALPQTSIELSEAVVTALLQMPSDSAAAVAGNYVGWTVPVSDKPVHDLMRTLGIGPYAGQSEDDSYTLISLLAIGTLLAVGALFWTTIFRKRPDESVAARLESALPEGLAFENEDVSAIRNRFETLTQRESEVLACLVDGASNKAIARQMDISPRTVEFHRANVMQKMAAGSLAELIRAMVIIELIQKDKDSAPNMNRVT